MLVDGGLVETYAGGVALTSFASPGPAVPPAARVAALWGVTDQECDLSGWRLAL